MSAFENIIESAFLSSSDLSAMQDDLLKSHVAYAATHSPFYRRLFRERGIDPAAIRSVGDLAMLPFTTKSDLAENGPDFVCVEESQIADICLTSGTTGRAIAMVQTRRDLERLAVNEEIAFRGAGVSDGDRVLIAAAIDRCFMAGLAYFLGLSRIGATVIRGGSSSIAVLADLVRYQRPSVLIGVPSLLLTLAERLRADGFDPASAGIKGIVCIGEPVRTSELKLSALGRSLAGNWGARVYGTYASTEMAATFADCPQGCGGHLPAGLLAVEIVDETGRVLSPGQAGEVVATPLQVTGMPLLRFRTGDIATLHDDPCCCGRKTFRLGPVLGRKNQMLKFRGTTLFPPAIFSALQELPGVQGYYLEVFSDFELSDRIRVVVGVGDADIDAATIEEKIVSRTRVKPEVVLAPPAEVQKKTVQESKRKPVTFFDYREQPAT